MRRALRIEVQVDDDGLGYVALFDADSHDGRHAAKYAEAKLAKVEQAVKRHAPHRILRGRTRVRLVSHDAPAVGAICPPLDHVASRHPVARPGNAARLARALTERSFGSTGDSRLWDRKWGGVRSAGGLRGSTRPA